MGKVESAGLLLNLWSAEKSIPDFAQDVRAVENSTSITKNDGSIDRGAEGDLITVLDHMEIVALFLTDGLLEQNHFDAMYGQVFVGIKKAKYLDHFDKKDYPHIRKVIK